MYLIVLTSANSGNDLSIRYDQINKIFLGEDSKHSVIIMLDGSNILVKETPAEIVKIAWTLRSYTL